MMEHSATLTFRQWVKHLTFYEILVGMKATITVFMLFRSCLSW